MSKSKKFDFLNFEPPSYSDTIKISGLSTQEMLVFAHDAAYELDWVIDAINEHRIVASSGISFSSYGETITIKISSEEISISSKTSGSQRVDLGKNQENVEAFYGKFNKMIESFDPAEVEEKYQKLSEQIEESKRTYKPTPPVHVSRLFLDLFIPKEGYFITPILFSLNLLVFVLMLLSGVNIFEPDILDLVKWGGSAQVLLVEGDWWRTITSTFVHKGLAHIMMNMFALIYIGRILEPLIGKERYLCAYLIAGLMASIASGYWHDDTVGVGASGAILGMFGVCLMVLKTKIIDNKPVRNQLFKRLLVIVTMTLAYGLQPGIDNAAHIGGLLSGVAVGAAYLPSLLKKDSALNLITISTLVTVSLCFSYFTLDSINSDDIINYRNDMQEVSKFEEKALSSFISIDAMSAETANQQLQTQGIDNLEVCVYLLEKSENYNIPEKLKSKNRMLKRIFNLRINILKTFLKKISANNDKYNNEIAKYSSELKQAMEEFRKVEE